MRGTISVSSPSQVEGKMVNEWRRLSWRMGMSTEVKMTREELQMCTLYH
jgi:hypothetical protein